MVRSRVADVGRSEDYRRPRGTVLENRRGQELFAGPDEFSSAATGKLFVVTHDGVLPRTHAQTSS